MTRRRKIKFENENNELNSNNYENNNNNNNNENIPSNTMLSKISLLFSFLLVFFLFLYAKFKPKKIINNNNENKNNELNYIEKQHLLLKQHQQGQGGQLLHNDIYLNILLINVNNNNNNNNFDISNNMIIYDQILNKYQKYDNDFKQQNFYLIISNYLQNENKNELFSNYLSLSNGIEYLTTSRPLPTTNITTTIIPSNHIFHESLSFSSSPKEKILYSLLSIYKYTEALKYQLITSRRKNNPPLHLRLYVPDIFIPLYQTVLLRIFSLNPIIESLIEVTFENLLSNSSDIDSSSNKTQVEKLVIYKNEIENIFLWKRFKTINDLERYLLLEGKSIF